MVTHLRERAVYASLLSLFAATLAIPASAIPSHVRVQAAVSGAPFGPALLPTGQYLDAAVAPGSSFQRLSTNLRPDYTGDAAGAMTTVLSPDGTRLLVLTSGYNKNVYPTTEGTTPLTIPYLDPTTGKPSTVTTNFWNWVFVFDVTGGKVPVKLQAIQIPDTFAGITWSPDGTKFYVSGGKDDRVYVYANQGGTFVPAPPFYVLNHNSNPLAPRPNYDGGIAAKTAAGKKGLVFGAETAGVAISADGKTLYAANLQNDSISVINAATQKVNDFPPLYAGLDRSEGRVSILDHASHELRDRNDR
jgi:DNA-binding beta-propeller fold protein YncE